MESKKMKKPEPIKCPRCRGNGTFPDMHYWSDGWGVVEAICELCNGKKTLDTDLITLAIRYKKIAAKKATELQFLRGHVALYLATSEGTLPDPPLRNAPNPSPHASTWKMYLEEAARKCPREPQKK